MSAIASFVRKAGRESLFDERFCQPDRVNDKAGPEFKAAGDGAAKRWSNKDSRPLPSHSKKTDSRVETHYANHR